jgi:hypothetical protein
MKNIKYMRQALWSSILSLGSGRKEEESWREEWRRRGERMEREGSGK